MSDKEPDKEPESGGAQSRQGPQRISIGRFQEVDLRVGRVLAAEPHPRADKLLVLQVDLGEAAPRQLVAGIRPDWDPQELPGRDVVVVANLEPARLRGVESQGMLLAVRGSDRILPLTVEGAVEPGTKVT